MRTADGRKIWERFTQWKKLNLDRLSKLIFFFITPLQLVDIKTWPNILKSTPVADFPAVLNDNMVYWLNSTYRKQNTWMINYTGNIIQNTSTCSRFLQVPLGAVLPMQQTAINASIRPPSLEKFTVPRSYQWQLKLITFCFMDYDNWVGRTRTFDRDDPSFWGGFPSIPAFIGRCSPLTKLKMTASSIQRDWYFTSLTPFCSIWRDLYGGHLCIYKGNKSATQNMTKWLSTIGFFFTPAFRVEDGAICEKFYFQEGMTCQ